MSYTVPFFRLTAVNETYLIRETYNRVHDGDILVSDMYLPYAAIQQILVHAGFTKKVNLFVSPSGKLQGWLWKRLTSTYDIRMHVGDNYWSDVVKAYEHGIRPEWTTLHAFTPLEIAVKDLGFRALALVLRRFRLDNPYTPDTKSYILYDDQARINLPVLLLLVVQLKSIMQREQLNRLLLTTRDGCLLEKLFNYLIPSYVSNITVIKFHSSRLAYQRRQPEYERYVQEVYIPNDSIIFDLRGYFITGRPLFKHLFNNTLPRVHLLSADTNCINDTTYSPDLTYSLVDYLYFEFMNVDVVGQLLSVFVDENTGTRRFMRAPVHGYPIDFARVIHRTIDAFCSLERRSEVIHALQQVEDVLKQPKVNGYVDVDVDGGMSIDVGVAAGSNVVQVDGTGASGSMEFGHVFSTIHTYFPGAFYQSKTLHLMCETFNSFNERKVCVYVYLSIKHPIDALNHHTLSIYSLSIISTNVHSHTLNVCYVFRPCILLFLRTHMTGTSCPPTTVQSYLAWSWNICMRIVTTSTNPPTKHTTLNRGHSYM